MITEGSVAPTRSSTTPLGTTTAQTRALRTFPAHGKTTTVRPPIISPLDPAT